MLPVFSDGRWRATKQLATGDTVTIAAKDVRDEKTGLHANIGIAFNGNVAAYSVFNIGRDEERVRIARSAHSVLTKSLSAETYKVNDLKADLDLFCLELAEAFTERFQVEVTREQWLPADGRMALRPYLLFGGGTILFGPPGGGKSWATYAMALSIHHGITSLWPVTQSPVLFINLERSAVQVKHRFAQLTKILGIQHSDLPMIHARGSSLSSVAESARNAVRRYGAGVVFLDSISRSGAGSLVKDDVANSTVDTLSSICPTWLGIGHTARDNGDHVFGSMHFDAGADIVVKFSSEERNNKLGVSMLVTKANDIRKPPRELLSFEFDGDGDFSRLIDIVPAGLHDFPELSADAPMSRLERLKTYVLQVGEATNGQASSETGLDKADVSRFFNKSGLFHQTRKQGKEVYFGVLVQE